MPIRVQDVVSQKFIFTWELGRSEISFSANLNYFADYASEGIYWYNEGTFEIVAENIILKPRFCRDHREGTPTDCSVSLGAAICILHTDESSMYYSKFLKCTSQINRNVLGMNSSTILFPVPESKLPAGIARDFNGIQVITQGCARGITTENVKIRTGPSISSKEIQFRNKLHFYPDAIILDYVPRGSELHLIARTIERERIQSWENYWYLVDVGIHHEVWMFGQFLRLVE